MKNQPIPSEIPKAPKVTKISSRFIIAMSALLVLVLLLFFYFMIHYQPQKKGATNTSEIKTSSTESATSLIQKIETQPHQPMLVRPKVDNKKRKDRDNSGLHARISYPNAPNDDETFSKNDFKQGSQAAISVFHRSIPAVSNQDSANNSYGGIYPVLPPQPANGSPGNNYVSQNSQSEKKAFLKTSHTLDKTTIQSTLQQPLSPYQIQAGTIIPATLMTGINSDLPGTIIAKVSRDVFDSASGNYLLIPQGTTLTGNYDSQIAYGQSRILIAWSRLLFPNGTSFNLNGMPGADLAGMAGLSDQVDNHYFRIFGSALMFSVFAAAGQLSQPQNNSKQLTSQQIIYGAIGQQMSQTAMQLVAKNMNIQPTVKIRPGANFNVLLTRDMVLPSPYRF